MPFRDRARLALAAAALLTVSPALAQDETVTVADPEAASSEREERDDFPLGLLGLLGLAGLWGLREKESDIHVDARRKGK